MTLKASRLFPAKKHFSLPLRYSVPIGVAGLIEGFAFTLDRYFLDKFIPLGTIGFYNLARQFSSVINVINSVFKLVFIPYIYKLNALKSSAGYMLGHISVVYSVLMTVPLVAVCGLAFELIKLLDPTGVYLQIAGFIPYFALAFYFSALATVMGRGMDLAGSSNWNFVIPLLGILSSLIVYFFTLPESGIMGILWSVIAGTFIRSLANIVLAVKFFPRKLYLNRLLLGWSLAAVIYCAILYVPKESILLSVITKAGLLLLLLALQLRVVVYRNINDSLKKTAGE